MASRTESFFGKLSDLISGSDALPGWSIIGVIYWMWFSNHPEWSQLKIDALSIWDNAEAITAVATGITFFLGNLFDDWLWPTLKPKKASKYTGENPAEFNIFDVLDISEGSYRVATKLLAAAERDFVPKTLNELAKASRSLAVMALFYAGVLIFGVVFRQMAFWWPLIPLALAGILGIWLYRYLKGEQILKYYERTRDLVVEQRQIQAALMELNPPYSAEKIDAQIMHLSSLGILEEKTLRKNDFFSLPPADQGDWLVDQLKSRLKFRRETTAAHQLFFWDGELVTSAIQK